MTGPNSIFGRTYVLVVTFLVTAMRLAAAGNSITWNFINLPPVGNTDQVIQFSATVTNDSDRAWQDEHYLEVRDQNGNHLNYVKVANTASGGTRPARFVIQLPQTPGRYTYRFSALEHGVEYFGPSVLRTIVVRPPLLDVSLTLDRPTIVIGERTIIRSMAGKDGEVGMHGLEGRALGGRWQMWTQWQGDGGDLQVTTTSPPTAGVYEMRAYAARNDDDEVAYSDRVLLEVIAIAPAIANQPTSVVANVGETVTLSVAASGSVPAFQWRKDGADLIDATTTTLRLSPTQVAQTGNYTVVVSNSAGLVTSRVATVTINAHALPAMGVEVWNFPASGGKRGVTVAAAQVGDVVSVTSGSNLTAGIGWHHNVLVRRPAVTSISAMAPEDGSGFMAVNEAWNKEGWGNPHTEGSSYDSKVTGLPVVDLGNREPFIHALAPGQTTSTRALDFVLDAPGTWLIRAEVVDGAGQPIGLSGTTSVNVAVPALASDPANITYPYGRTDRFVGVFWNAGQAHRLWSTWRADHQVAYAGTWAVNWKLMWQPSPYFRREDGSWLKLNPAADSPWQPFWSAHQVYAMVPDTANGGKLTHDLTSQTFAEKASLRLMDIGVDFVAVDYTNQFLEEREAVLPAVNNLALAFQTMAPQSQSGQRIKLSAVVPANVSTGDWAGSGGFTPLAIARFNAKLTTLFNRYARFESAWFYLEDDNGARKPLLLLWIGAGGEGEPDGTLAPGRLSQLRLADGRALTEVFTVRWVGAYLSDNGRYLSGGTYAVNSAEGTVTGKLANAKLWSYHEHFPSAATIVPGGSGAVPAIEAVTVQPLAAGRDRFGRAWEQNWPADQSFHYETPASSDAVPLANYGKTWRDALAAARALNPKFLLTTWAEFGSENDEPRPELSVTIMDNNKFGTHFGDGFKQAVRLFKYRAPTAWIDNYSVTDITQSFSDVAASTLPTFHLNQTVRLQGWVNPNVATTFTGGSVKIYVDDEVRGAATIGGSWNGATRWTFELSAANLFTGRHTIKVLADDGVGGTSLAGVQFRGEPPRNTLSIEVVR